MKARIQSGNGGFSLLELMVAMSVLTIIVVLVAQMTNGAAFSIMDRSKRIDADTQARAIFGRLSFDLAKMVRRSDLDYSTFKQPAFARPALSGTTEQTLPNLQSTGDVSTGANDSFIFYAEEHGYYSGGTYPPAPTPSTTQSSPYSLIGYYVPTTPPASTSGTFPAVPKLQRIAKGLGWEPNANAWGSVIYGLTSSATVTSSSNWKTFSQSTGPFKEGVQADWDAKTVGNQVFRFEYTYLLKSGKYSITPWDSSLVKDPTDPYLHTSIHGFTDVAAIVVAIAVLDKTSSAVIMANAATQYPDLLKQFPDAQDPTSDTVYQGDIASAWNDKVKYLIANPPSNIPKTVLRAIRIYQRTFYLDSK